MKTLVVPGIVLSALWRQRVCCSPPISQNRTKGKRLNLVKMPQRRFRARRRGSHSRFGQGIHRGLQCARCEEDRGALVA